MANENPAVFFENGSTGSKQIAVHEVMMNQSDPCIEEKRNIYSFDDTFIHFTKCSIRQMQGYGGLNSDESTSGQWAEKRALNNESRVEGFEFSNGYKVSTQYLDEWCIPIDMIVDSSGRPFPEDSDNCCDEIIPGWEV